MLSEWTTRNDRSVYCAYNPVSKTLPENYTTLWRRKDNRIRAQEEMANPTLYHHSRHIGVYMKHCTLTDLSCPHNRLRRWYHYLPCKTEKTKVHRDRILSPLLFLIILYCLHSENCSFMTKLLKSPQSIYVSYNSQSSTISQKVLQRDNHLWKNVLVSYSKITSVRHLLVKFMFPYRNLSSTKQTIYSSVLRIMWLSVDKIVETEEVWIKKSISVSC